ncbi:MAG TPA: DUF2950 domain-containing protein [Verrucomicrobiae bacterium]|nr:DUF2950 domain-containing protein [Verrucomicrobiae bacterium]
MKTLFKVGVSALLIATASYAPAADVGTTFASPEEAAQALATAAGAKNREALRALFGLDADEFVAADQVQMENDLEKFEEAFQAKHHLTSQSDTNVILEVGQDDWPFPIPLVKKDGRWYFDTDAGKEELLNRRIGRDELATLQTVRAYVEAQREYAGRDRMGDEVLQYAQKFASTPGKKDGLYWPPDLDGEISPLGPLVAEAQEEGYSKKDKVGPVPYHGYYFKILTRQGSHAPGGKYSYIINGRMIAGFALVAWPAQYGESGIMTFIVNQQGRVYQKDLGPKTDELAPAMTEYDPDSTWRASPD